MSDFVGIFFTAWFLLYLFQAFFGGIISLFPKPPADPIAVNIVSAKK